MGSCWCSPQSQSDLIGVVPADGRRDKNDGEPVEFESANGTDGNKANENTQSHRPAQGRHGHGPKLQKAKTHGPVEEHLGRHKKERKMGRNTQKLVRSGIQKDRFCAMMEEEQVETILTTMEYFEFKAGDPVVTQGDMGNTFFVTHHGTLAVSVDGKGVVNTMGAGAAFGGIALLYGCPRTASVTASSAAGVWGANGDTFQKVSQDNATKLAAENRKFVDSIPLFDGLPQKRKDLIGEACGVEVFEKGMKVVVQGESGSTMYFIKKGTLQVIMGGKVKQDGTIDGGTDRGTLGAGASFGEAAVIHGEPRGSTVIATERSELLSIGEQSLKEILGENLREVLLRSQMLLGLKKSLLMLPLTSTAQQSMMVQQMIIKDFKAGDAIDTMLRFCIVLQGDIEGADGVHLHRLDCYEDDALVEEKEKGKRGSFTAADASMALAAFTKPKTRKLKGLQAGRSGAQLGMLTREGYATALKKLGLSDTGSAEEAKAYTHKMLLAMKVHILRNLSPEQLSKLIRSFQLVFYERGDKVFEQGEMGDAFYVIQSGEVRILIDGRPVRTLKQNTYFGERALLFNEKRSATVEVTSEEAELWKVDKTTFTSIVTGNMKQVLLYRIMLQDESVTMKDLKQIKVIGAGAAGVVRLVEHKKNKTRYALKRVRKENGQIPEDVKRECELLKENDHPFIMYLVKTFETKSSVYMLTELITGGELFSAIRNIPQVLNVQQAQFYTGSLVLVLEELTDRSIVFRDLKPENVMLDQQGYLKLIDFGIAKKLDENTHKTFTCVGTAHYMAPEVIRGRGYGTEVDIWSLGVMLYEFVCGSLPFADDLEEPADVYQAVLKDPLKFPAAYKHKPGRKLIEGMLCRQRKERIGSGLSGFEDIKNAEFFTVGHEGSSTVFNKILGREHQVPWMPPGETYGDPDETSQIVLSDQEELG